MLDQAIVLCCHLVALILHTQWRHFIFIVWASSSTGSTQTMCTFLKLLYMEVLLATAASLLLGGLGLSAPCTGHRSELQL